MSTTSNILPPINNNTDKDGRALSLGQPSEDWAATTQQAILGQSKTPSEPPGQFELTHPEMVRGESTRSVASTIALDMPGAWGRDKPDAPFSKAGEDGPDIVANDVRGVLSAVSEKAQSLRSGTDTDKHNNAPEGVNAPSSGVEATGPPGHPGNSGPGVIEQVRGAFGNLMQGTTNALSGTAQPTTSSPRAGDSLGTERHTEERNMHDDKINPDPTLNDPTTTAHSANPNAGYTQQVTEALTGLYNNAAGAIMGGRDEPKTAPATGGVGDLPGAKGERDVARLPEERAHPDTTIRDTTLKEPIPTADREKPSDTNDQGYLQQARDKIGNMYASATGAVMSGPGPVKLDQNTGKPFQNREVTSGGVGDLPGDDSEVSVAKLPEERAHPDPYAESAPNKTRGPEEITKQSAGPTPDSKARTGGAYLLTQPPESTLPATSDKLHAGDEKNAGILASALDSNTKKTDVPVDETVRGVRPVTPLTESEAAQGRGPINDPALAGATMRDPPGGTGHHLGIGHHHHHEGKGIDKKMGRQGTIGEKDADSHFGSGRVGADHVGQSPSSPKSHGVTLSKTISGPSSPTKIESGSHFKSGHGRSASTSSTGKPSFMDKVKGEMKVISGKITRDERKVEEGKALKSAGHHGPTSSTSPTS
ncbi:hypothetical protein FRC03_003786 [Tulasnella sp. 419]|nr:hypothetical protein FRC03_003786 [Tulasnella sp. 419]